MLISWQYVTLSVQSTDGLFYTMIFWEILRNIIQEGIHLSQQENTLINTFIYCSLSCVQVVSPSQCDIILSFCYYHLSYGITLQYPLDEVSGCWSADVALYYQRARSARSALPVVEGNVSRSTPHLRCITCNITFDTCIPPSDCSLGGTAEVLGDICGTILEEAL